MSDAGSISPTDWLQQLGDRQAIADLIARLGIMLDEKRFDGNGIRQLYESDAYPLNRRAARA